MTSRDLRSSRRAPEPGKPYPEPLSILGVTNVVLRNRRLVVGVMFLFALIAVVWTALAPRVYMSSATFIPAGKKAPLQAASGLAAQFGISVPGADPQQSPDFYVALLHSRSVQNDVVNAQYAFNAPNGPFRGTLLDYYGGKNGPLARRRATALRTLNRQILTGTSLKTGAVNLSVQSFSPVLAEAIARNLMAAVDQFNRTRLQTQSVQERQFTEEQLATAAAELRAAEDQLENFQESNRVFGAPRLNLDRERLLREVSMRQQLYTSLAQAYAQARIDAVRDNPSVVVLESPEVAADPEPRGLLRSGVLALLAGLFLGVLLAFMREHILRTKELHPEEDAEYTTLRAAVARDLRNPLRLLGVHRR
jgi:uncharacterized protein involved in exopolysaccharide biosynthesis